MSTPDMQASICLTEWLALKAEVAGLKRANEQLFEHGKKMFAERETLQVRVAGYQGSRDWAIKELATALGIEPDTVRPLEYFARLAAERINAGKPRHVELPPSRWET